MKNTVEGRRVVVVGLGASGIAAAKLCLRQGAARVVLNDRRSLDEIDLGAQSDLANGGVEFSLGGHYAEVFEEADVIVLSPGVPPLNAVRDAEVRGCDVVSEVELASWYCAADIVAITGTNGKSTVTTLVGEMLQSQGFATFAGGNLGVPFSDAIGTDAARAGGRVVLELSSFQLEKIHRFHPRVAVYLNLTADHLDRYGSIAEYGATKARIFMNQRPEDHAVVPGDDPLMVSFARAFAAKVHTYGGEQSELRIVGESLVGPGGFEMPVASLKIRGTHNVGNAMAAALAAHHAGASAETIRAVLERFVGLPHRMQFVLEEGGVTFYDDSKATNVGAAVKALEGIDRKVVLIAGGRDKGGSYEPLVQLLRMKARAVVLLGEAAPIIAEALGASVPYTVAGNMAEAVQMAQDLAHPGDCVLLAPACSSLDMFKSYAERGDAFAAEVRRLAEAAL